MSMMVLDCERLRWDVGEIIAGMDRGEYGYTDLLFDMCIVRDEEIDDSLPPAWNHLEHYEPGETRLLHYTVVPTQPWKSDANPLCDLWEQAFAEAAPPASSTRRSSVRPSGRGTSSDRSPAGRLRACRAARSTARSRGSCRGRRPPCIGFPERAIVRCRCCAVGECRPRVSVVIPTWNGRALLDLVLPSLERQRYRDFETLVVDNGSSDGTAEHVRERWPWAEIVALPTNVGFAAGVNAASSARRATMSRS